MLYPSHFDNQLIRKYLVAFGSFFDNISVVRTNDTTKQKIAVPIEYGPKERWLTRIVQDPKFLQGVGQIVPRMAYEMTGFSYDSTRKLNTLNKLTFPSATAQRLARTYVGVPYNLTIDLHILTKYQTDAFQIVEQILPFFTPDLQFAINVIPSLGLVDQVPLVIAGVTHSDNYEGDFEHRRAITWTLTFTMKVNVYGPQKTQAQIDDVLVDLYLGDDFTDEPQLLETEDNSLLTTEDSLGHILTEDTNAEYVQNGRVARIESILTPIDQLETPNPTATTTVTETIPPTVSRNLDGTDTTL